MAEAENEIAIIRERKTFVPFSYTEWKLLRVKVLRRIVLNRYFVRSKTVIHYTFMVARGRVGKDECSSYLISNIYTLKASTRGQFSTLTMTILLLFIIVMLTLSLWSNFCWIVYDFQKRADSFMFIAVLSILDNYHSFFFVNTSI